MYTIPVVDVIFNRRTTASSYFYSSNRSLNYMSEKTEVYLHRNDVI